MVKDHPNQTSGPPQGHSALPLWVRVSAMVLGALGGSAGAWAAFISSNQAGTAMLLIASVALLLVGLQGTPILRIGASEASVELAEIQQKAVETVENIREEEGAEAAHLVGDALSEIDVRLYTSSPYRLMYEVYEVSLAAAVQRIGVGTVSRRVLLGRMELDFLIARPDGSQVGIEVKHATTRGLTMSQIDNGTRALERGLLQGLDKMLLVVGEAERSKAGRLDAAMKEVQDRYPDKSVGWTCWRDPRDDDWLKSAIESL